MVWTSGRVPKFIPENLYINLNKVNRSVLCTSAHGRCQATPEGMTSQLPSVGLGLPTVPPGKPTTKTFTYSKDVDYDFTLGEQKRDCKENFEAPSIGLFFCI